MAAVSRFVSLADGFEARIDEETGGWIVSPVGPNANQNSIEFYRGMLEARAPANGDYTAEVMKNWWGNYAAVEHPRHWTRMLRAQLFFPDGEVVVEYESSGDEGKNLIY